MVRQVAPAPADPLDAATKAYVDTAVAQRIANATLDFGPADGVEDTTATTVVTAAWADAGRVIVCVPDPAGTADHSAEDAVVERVHATVTAVTPGVGFTVAGHAPEGTWGRYSINCLG